MVKTTDPEEEYFKKLDAQKKKELAERVSVQEAEARTRELKELHWMHCPKCGHDLKEITFRGVLIDQCTQCNGVWLDDGELEKLAGKESTLLRSFLESFRPKE